MPPLTTNVAQAWAWDASALVPRQVASANGLAILAARQKYIIQVVVTVMASLSITAAVVALYWFCVMRRNFRRDLVMLLILGDVFKNFDYLLFSGVSLSSGNIQSTDAFCQASGYLLQTGFELCDLAILFISLHMVLQIFPLPNTILGYEGLYNIRYWVYASWFLLPNLSAALAFVNDRDAYQVQGAFCWLPVRPFWYRLALAWIPRYIITILILLFAIMIYRHVGAKIKLFGADLDASSDDGSASNQTNPVDLTDPGLLSVASATISQADHERRPSTAANLDETQPNPSDDPSGKTNTDSRRMSLPTWHSPFEGQAIGPVRAISQSASPSRRGSKQVTFGFRRPGDEPLSPMAQPATPVSNFTPATSTTISGGQPTSNGILGPLPSPRPESSRSSITHVADPMRQRRRAIKRQVKSLFIYPVAYLVFWTVPFIAHSMNYNDGYAKHPVFAVSLLSSFSITTLGLVDVLIFTWRERPWLHIPDSDGTIIGSFCFWRLNRHHTFNERRVSALPPVSDEKSQHEEGFVSLVKRSWTRLSKQSAGLLRGAENTDQGNQPRRKYAGRKGGSDSTVKAREMAQLRLQRELQSAQMRAFEVPESPAPASPGDRNWFDDMSDVDVPVKTRRPTWHA